MTPRTVAIVSPYYPPKIGGVEVFVGHIARAVAAEPDLSATVITTRPSGLRTTVAVEDGVRVVRLGAWLRLSNSPISPLWPVQVRRWLRKTGARLVSAHGPVPGLGDVAVFAAGRRPVTFSFHSGTMHKGEPGTRLADWIIDRYERTVLPRVLRRTTVPVAASPVCLTARHPGAVMISPGVDPDVFVPGAPASTRPRDIVYVGRIDRTSAWKGVDVLVKAMTMLPDARLRLVGTGDALPDHLKLAADLGVAERVEAVGALAGGALVEAMQSAAVLVLPSRTDAESFGMVLIEAMACGTPVVTTTLEGPAFALEGSGAGLTVPPGDPEALAKACRTLLEDGALADEMGAAGRKHVEERFVWAEQTGRYVALFRSLLDD